MPRGCECYTGREGEAAQPDDRSRTRAADPPTASPKGPAAEAVSETIARACVDYAGLARRRKLHRALAGSLATYAAQAIGAGRRVAGEDWRTLRSKPIPTPPCKHRSTGPP